MNVVCGLVDYSLGGGNGAGKTNVKLSETLRIQERMPISFQQAVWRRGRIVRYDALKGFNRRPRSSTQNVLGFSSTQKEE